MTSELRKTGISVVGDIPWGTHFCYFYETKQDLLDILVPYFKVGLENNEFCLWIISNSELLTTQEAMSALRKALPDLDRYLARGSIEVVAHDDWFLYEGAFDLHRVANRFKEKLDETLARGHAGMRVNGSPAWIYKEDGQVWREFEEELAQLFPKLRVIASCTYPLAASGAAALLDVASTHQFAIARRQGNWDIVETPELKQAKVEIQRLNDELELRVVERTQELEAANEQLRREISERKQAEALLHAREQEFRAFVENTPDQIIRYDKEFRRAYVNPAVTAAYGLPKEAFIGKPVGSAVEDTELKTGMDEIAAVRRQIKSVFDTGEPTEYEVTWQLPRGRKTFWVRMFPEFDPDGKVLNVLGVARDITERNLVEETLRQAEERFRALIENSADGLGMINYEGATIYVSPAIERIFGLTMEEVKTLRVDLIHPDDLDRVLNTWNELRATPGKLINYQYRFRYRDGTWRWLDVTAHSLFSDPSVRALVVNFRDITERKLAEEALKESQRRLEEAQRIAHVGHWERDLRTGVINWSDEIYRILGLERQGSPPIVWEHMIHPEDRERILLATEEAQRGIGRYDVEYRIVRPDGEVRFLHSQGDIIRDEHGELCRAFGIAQDITEHKRAEEALRQAEEKYHSIFEHAIEGIFQTTPDGQYITVNPALARMLGYASPQELMSSRTDIGQQQYVLPERRADFKRLLEEQSVVQGFEYQAYRKDGSKIWLSDNGRAVRDESGAVLYYEGFTEDITERKLAEEALKKEKEILKKIFDNVPVLIGFVGEDGRVKLVNPEWERTMGWTLKELQEQDVDIFTEAYPDLSYRQDVLDFVAASTGEWVDLKIKVRDGRVIDAACAVVHLSDGTKVAIAQDITERKRAEEMLQTFSQRLIETQEAERRRVARELHDEIGQALTAIKINLQAVQHSAGASPLVQQLNESASIVDHALQQVRDLSFNLRPSLLDDLGLIAALRWYVDREARRAGLIPEFVADLSETRLPPELETACFRITQEALTNVMRHAQASHVWVELRQRGAELYLAIRDDGIGFDVSAVRRRRSSEMNLGLQGMQERALILGGQIEIQSAQGRGTEIHVWLPLTLSRRPQRRESDAW